MALKSSAPLASLALLLFKFASAADMECVLKTNPPAGAICGVVGYLGNWNGFATDLFDQQYLTPSGCAEACVAQPNCASWYLGSWFCELHTLDTSAALFHADGSSWYSGYDQSCFTCQPKTVTCPDSDGSQVTIGAATYDIHCATDFYGGDLARVDAATFQDCLTSCSSTMGCVSVAYSGENCYMKDNLNHPHENSNVWGAALVSADEDAAKRLSCPGNDGATYTAKSGDQFTVQCGIDYYGGDLSSLYAEWFEDCLEACDTTPGCLDVAYNGDSKYCYLKNAVTEATQNSAIWGAVKQDAKVRRQFDGSVIPETLKYDPHFLASNSTA